MHSMKIMTNLPLPGDGWKRKNVTNAGGHSVVTWEPKTDDERFSEAAFNKLMAQGYEAVTLDASGEPAEMVHRFDPKADMILKPRSAGG